MYQIKELKYELIILIIMLALMLMLLTACFHLEMTPTHASMQTSNPTSTLIISTTTPTPTCSATFTPKLIEEATSTVQSSAMIEREYKWSFDHSEWTWTLKVPEALYYYYKQLPRTPTRDYSIYVTNPEDDSYLEMLTQKIKDAAAKARFSEWETVNFAVSFVQSLPYTSDNITTTYDEYARYPIETLVDNGGDCEDTSILMAAILKPMGYDNVLISLPNHVAVGVPGVEGIHGTYYKYNGEKYYYLETTSEGWEIGEMPPEYKGN